MPKIIATPTSRETMARDLLAGKSVQRVVSAFIVSLMLDDLLQIAGV